MYQNDPNDYINYVEVIFYLLVYCDVLILTGKSASRNLHSNAVGGGMVFAGGNKVM